MEILDLIFLSAIQGLTEFLPVSSSAHLIILGEYLSSEDQGIVFDVAVHVGTLLAAIIYFRSDVIEMLKGLTFRKKDQQGTRQLINLSIAVLPVLIVGFLARDFVDDYLRSAAIIAYSTIVFGIVLYISDRTALRSTSLNTISPYQSLVIGLSQCLALIPGTSRSGITISAALFLGIDRESAAKFSFLLAIPTIGAIACSELINLNFEGIASQGWNLLISALISFLVAYLTIDLFLKLISKIGFTPFVIYRIFLGLGLLVFWI